MKILSNMGHDRNILLKTRIEEGLVLGSELPVSVALGPILSDFILLKALSYSLRAGNSLSAAIDR